MKEKFWLIKRGSAFYSLDSDTRERKSLGTSDRHEAQKIIRAKNESTDRPTLDLSLAKADGEPADNGSGRCGNDGRSFYFHRQIISPTDYYVGCLPSHLILPTYLRRRRNNNSESPPKPTSAMVAGSGAIIYSAMPLSRGLPQV